MYLYKKLRSPKLTLRDYNVQVGELLANVKVMNTVIRLGMLVLQQIN
ncbi:Mobile element protein [Candidatus Enterovibrio escicola]|uniref:Mobile element protein n=1 Tax=Candidatus Enterovibrio escicola TaxID=1927127 RepID=A0A2A5T2U1_9GAMM|nr:Mobile element protein [Candidatus Enterovibrio escacola]